MRSLLASVEEQLLWSRNLFESQELQTLQVQKRKKHLHILEVSNLLELFITKLLMVQCLTRGFWFFDILGIIFFSWLFLDLWQFLHFAHLLTTFFLSFRLRFFEQGKTIELRPRPMRLLHDGWEPHDGLSIFFEIWSWEFSGARPPPNTSHLTLNTSHIYNSGGDDWHWRGYP